MRSQIRFCSQCGAETRREVPPADDRERFMCTRCRRVHYQNPRNVVGCLVEKDGGILLCKRAIEPRVGTWTLPAGFQELGESAMQGALRETFEEAGIEARIVAPYVHFDIPHIGQSYVFYRARHVRQSAAPGPESQAAEVFGLDELPWDELSFDVVRISLELYVSEARDARFRSHHGAIVREDERPGIRLGSCSLQEHLAMDVSPPRGASAPGF